jgi:Isochorismatase family
MSVCRSNSVTALLNASAWKVKFSCCRRNNLAPHPGTRHSGLPFGQTANGDNEEFVAAVKKTGRKKLIMAGVTTDVCLAFPAMQAVADGFQVYGVIDASGAHDLATQQMAVQRLIAHGVTPVTWLMIAAELQRDWRNETAAGTFKLFHEHLLNYGMLIDNHAYLTQAMAKQGAAT